MYSELSKAIIETVKAGFPEIESVFRYSLKAVVTGVDPPAGVATVQPLRPDGSIDDQSPEIPDVPLPRIPGLQGPVFVVPDVGTEVVMQYLYQDPSQPVIGECLGTGHTRGWWHHSGDVKIEGDVQIIGDVEIIGDLEVIGKIHATKTIIDDKGNTNHHGH